MAQREAVEALVAHEQGVTWQLETVYLDVESLQPDEVIVDMKASSICHTDTAYTDGTMPRSFPTVAGHEGVGIVRKIGKDITRCTEGDKVVLSWAYCRECKRCKDGHPSQCARFDEFNQAGLRIRGRPTYYTQDGRVVFAALLGTSTFARAVIVNESSIIKVSSTQLDFNLLAPLGCGLSTGASAVINVANLKQGQSIAVFGLGAVGMAAVMAAKLTPSVCIVAVDLLPDRLELATQLGATTVINARKAPDVVKAIKELTNGEGVHYSIECTGVKAVLRQAYDALACGGSLIHLGLTHWTEDFDFNIVGNIRYSKRIIGCVEGDCVPEELIPELIKHHEQGRFPYEKLCKKYPFADFQQALDDMESGAVIKAILVFT